MPKEIIDMIIREVSAVDKAATRKKFLLIKKEKEDDSKKGKLEKSPKTHKEDLSDKGGENMSELEKILAEIEDEDLKKMITDLVESLQKKEDDDEGKEDFNKAEIPEELKKRFEDLEKKAEIAENMAKAEREKRLEVEFNKKAKGYANVAEVEKIAGILRKASDVDDEFAGEIEEVLSSANERLENANIFKEKGGNGADATDAEETIEKKTKELMKADTSLTYAKAQSRVLRENPDLYEDYVNQM